MVGVVQKKAENRGKAESRKQPPVFYPNFRKLRTRASRQAMERWEK